MGNDDDWDNSFGHWDKPRNATLMGQLDDANPFTDTRILWKCNTCGGVFWWTRMSMALGLFIPLDPRIKEDRLRLEEIASNNLRVQTMFNDSAKCACPDRPLEQDDDEDDSW
jgi:hypothetical protein